MKGLLTGLLCLGAFTNAQATAFNFECITFNGTGTCDTAEAQMKLDVTSYSATEVLFEFSNNSIGATTDKKAIIGEVYFYDGIYLDVPPTVINGTGVDFTQSITDTNPAMLPGYNYTPLSVFAAADVTKNTKDGVQVGDGTLGVLFTLLPDVDFNTVIAAIESGELVIGIHAKALGTADISESLITTTVVPVPAAVWLFGTGLLGLVGVARRRT